MITREKVAKMLGDYLHGDLALNELVDWSENSIAEEGVLKGVTWEQIGNLAEELSGIVAGGSFEHKNFRINEVSSCFVKINIMFSNTLL